MILEPSLVGAEGSIRQDSILKDRYNVFDEDGERKATGNRILCERIATSSERILRGNGKRGD